MIHDLVLKLEDLEATEANILRAFARTNSSPLREDLTRQLKHIRAEIKNVLSVKLLAEDIRKHERWATHTETHVQ